MLRDGTETVNPGGRRRTDGGEKAQEIVTLLCRTNYDVTRPAVLAAYASEYGSSQQPGEGEDCSWGLWRILDLNLEREQSARTVEDLGVGFPDVQMGARVVVARYKRQEDAPWLAEPRRIAMGISGIGGRGKFSVDNA